MLCRYYDVLPYDATRVRLPPRNEGYINANWITEPQLTPSPSTTSRTTERRRWIAAQGPLPHTTGDFLSLFCDLDSAPRVIVQLTQVRWILILKNSSLMSEGEPHCQLIERGTTKCSAYLPPVGVTWTFPLSADPKRSVTIRRVNSSQGCNYVTSEVELSAPSHSAATNTTAPATVTTHRVTHFELIDWPDHGVPKHAHGLTQMIEAIDQNHAQRDPQLETPVLVHCSAGVGRTGTLIVLSSLLHQLKDMQREWQQGTWPEDQDPVALAVDEVREQRAMMVQSAELLAFVRRAFVDAWRSSMIDS